MATTAIRRTSPLAVVSAGIGAIGVIIWLTATHESDVARVLGSLPGGVMIGLFFLIGCLAILCGTLALLRMNRTSQGGTAVAVIGLVLGLFNVLLGLGGIAVSNFRPLGPGPF